MRWRHFKRTQVVRIACCTPWSPCCAGVQLCGLVPHSGVSSGLGRVAERGYTAEMTAMIEALYCLGLRGSVARHEEACIFYDSKHAAGVCLGTIQARSHVQLAWLVNATLCVQHRLRLTTFTAMLGTWVMNVLTTLPLSVHLVFISSHNDATRWGRHNFDTNALCDGCNNISEILERLDHARTEATVKAQDVS